jgi:hypothetical protein
MLLEVLKPDHPIADVSIRLSAQAAHCPPQQFPKWHLIADRNAKVGLSLRTVFAVKKHVVADVVRNNRAVLSKGCTNG